MKTWVIWVIVGVILLVAIFFLIREYNAASNEQDAEKQDNEDAAEQAADDASTEPMSRKQCRKECRRICRKRKGGKRIRCKARCKKRCLEGLGVSGERTTNSAADIHSITEPYNNENYY